MKKFIDTERYGQLNIDKVFFESYFPIIFTCRSSNNKLFFVVCYKNNSEGCKWLVAKTNSAAIIRLLKDEITAREVLLQSQERFSVDYNGAYAFNESDEDFNASSIYLPKKDSYMYAEEGEFDEEIVYYSNANTIVYAKENYKNVIENIATINENLEDISEALNSFCDSIRKITVNVRITDMLVEFGTLAVSSKTSDSEHELYTEYKPMQSINMDTVKNMPSVELDNDTLADAA